MGDKENRWRDFGAIVVRLTNGENITREEAKECWRQICPRLAGANATKVHVARSGRPVLPHWTTSTLACVTDPQLDEFLSQDVGGSIETFGSWVGLYQDPHNRKHSKRGWDLQASATCQGVTYANWYTDWGEPDHHLGCDLFAAGHLRRQRMLQHHRSVLLLGRRGGVKPDNVGVHRG